MEGEAAGRQRQQQQEEGTSPSGEPEVPYGRSSSSPSPSRLGAAGGDAQGFHGALGELKDLQSQLHQAADCCEKAFLNTEKKKLILESTKSYIRDAVVAVIDHLGNVSSKLEHQLHDRTEITQTEQKINFFKQRLLTCEQYAISLKLLSVRQDTNALQYHRRYLSQSTECTKNGSGSNSSNDGSEPFEISSPASRGATRTLKPYDVQPTIGRERTGSDAHIGGNMQAAVRSSFSFRAAEEVHTVPGDHRNKKIKKASSHGSTVLSFLKKSKRHA